MASGKLGTLALYLTMNNEGLKKGAREAQGIVKGMNSGLKTLAGFFGVGLGAAGAVAALKSIYAALDEIGKGADRLSVTTDAYQELRYAARNTSADMSQVEMAVTKAGQAMEKAADGDKKMVAALRQLGLTWKDLAGLSPDKQLEMIGSALAGVEDEVQRNNAAIAIFGESGTKLMPFFNGLVDLRKEAQALGVVISEDTIRKAEATGDAFTRMGDKVMAMIADSGLIQWLGEVIDEMDAIINHSKLMDDSAAAGGAMDRPRAVKRAMSIAEKSGKYSKEDLDLMNKSAQAYGSGHPYMWPSSRKPYELIDKAMSEAGFIGLQKRRISKADNRSEYFVKDDPEAPAPTAEEKLISDSIEISNFARRFTSQASDLETAAAELKNYVAEQMKRELSTDELKLLEPQIAELKKRFDAIAAAEEAKKQAAMEASDKAFSDYAVKSEQSLYLAQMKINGATEDQIESQKQLFALNKEITELSGEQLLNLIEGSEAVAETNRLQKEQEQNKNFGEHMKDRFGSLRQMALKAGGYDAQAFAEQRLEEAATRKGAALTDPEAARISRLAELERRLTTIPAVDLSRLDTQTNELTRRGGFSNGAVGPSLESINQKIAAAAQRQETILRDMYQLMRQMVGG